jgi:hypothetical protein
MRRDGRPAAINAGVIAVPFRCALGGIAPRQGTTARRSAFFAERVDTEQLGLLPLLPKAVQSSAASLPSEIERRLTSSIRMFL